MPAARRLAASPANSARAAAAAVHGGQARIALEAIARRGLGVEAEGCRLDHADVRLAKRAHAPLCAAPGPLTAGSPRWRKLQHTSTPALTGEGRGFRGEEAVRAVIPFLRQSPEVPGLRQHLQREGRGGAAALGQELELVRPTPPALYFFDAGMGDGTVLSRLHAPCARRASHRAHGGGGQGDQPRGRAPRASRRCPIDSPSIRPRCS